MADARRTVNISFDGNVLGLQRAAVAANRSLAGVGNASNNVGRSLLTFAGRTLVVGAVLNVVALAAKAAAGFILLIPAAVLSLVAIVGVGALAMKGFGEAVAAATPAEFVTATRSMAPAMRDAVNTVRRARPEFYALRRLVQQGFWEGFSDDLRQLLVSYLPILNIRLPAIARGIGGIRTELVKALLKPSTLAAFDSFLQFTITMLERMRGSIGAFLAGFIKLANIGGAFLPRFGDWLARIAMNFEAWTDAGAASGSIARFIEEALDSFGALAAIFRNLYGAIVAIIDVVTADTGVPALVEFTASLRRFFESNAGAGLLKVLGAIFTILLKIITAVLDAVSAFSGVTGGTAGPGTGFFSRVGNFVGGLFGRAGGGSVFPGQSYIVGERGQEILTMGSRGFITPAGGRGTDSRPGEVVVNVYIGETELREIVISEVRGMVRDTARSVYSGLGVAG